MSHPKSYKDTYQLKEAVVVLENISAALAEKTKGEFLNVFGSIYTKPSYDCAKCGEKFDDSLKLKRHTMVHKLKGRNTKKKLTFRCYICVKQFSDRASCWNHMRVHSALQMGQNCKLCRMNFKSGQALAAHVSSCPSNNSGEVTNVKPKCCVCMMECASVDEMRTHRLMHDKKRGNPTVGEEKKKDQATGDEKQKDQVIRDDKKKNQATDDEKKKDQATSDDKRKDQVTDDEKKKNQATSDEKREDQATGDVKKKDQATAREKKKDEAIGDEKIKDQETGDENRKDQVTEDVKRKDQATGCDNKKDQSTDDEKRVDKATGDEKKVTAPPPQFKCCHQIFHSFDLLYVHMYHTFRISQESRCFPQYVCSICSTTFNERDDWCQHSVKRHDCNESTLLKWGQPLTCDRCEKIFADAIKVVQHKLSECIHDDSATTTTDNSSQKKVVSILVTRPTNNLQAIYNVGTKTLIPVCNSTTEIIPTAPVSILKTYSRRVLKHDSSAGVKTYERKKTVLPIVQTSLPQTDDVITLDESDEETPQNRMYACKLCTFKTTDFPLLEQHCSGSHKIPFVCPKCTNWYMSSTLFRLHQCPT